MLNIESQKIKTLLFQINKNKELIPSACNFWICWACKCKVLKWKENLEIKKTEYPLNKDEILTCVTKIKNKDSDIILEL